MILVVNKPKDFTSRDVVNKITINIAVAKINAEDIIKTVKNVLLST